MTISADFVEAGSVAASCCAIAPAVPRANIAPAAAANGHRIENLIMADLFSWASVTSVTLAWLTCWLGECHVGDGGGLLRRDVDLANAEHAPELVGRDLHRARGGTLAGRRLREGGRHRGLVGDVAFDLLHNLVDMA